MPVMQSHDGSWLAGDRAGWRVGVYATERAAKASLRIDHDKLAKAWDAKKAGPSGIIEPSEYFTEAEIAAMKGGE